MSDKLIDQVGLTEEQKLALRLAVDEAKQPKNQPRKKLTKEEAVRLYETSPTDKRPRFTVVPNKRTSK